MHKYEVTARQGRGRSGYEIAFQCEAPSSDEASRRAVTFWTKSGFQPSKVKVKEVAQLVQV